MNNTEAAASEFAKAVSCDALTAARRLQIANSPLCRGSVLSATCNRTSWAAAGAQAGHEPDPQAAVFQAKSSLLRQPMQTLWEHGTQGAAISHVLARKFTRLKPDEAMLAGLIHDIGALPILVRAENHPELLADDAQRNDIIDTLRAEIGRLILEAWKFPPELVAAEHENLARISEQVDYTDIVTAANLHSYLGGRHRHAKVTFIDVPAFAMLGPTPETGLSAMEEAAAEMREVKPMLAA